MVGRWGLVIATGALVALAGPAGLAHAAEPAQARVEDGAVLFYTAGPGQANRLVVTRVDNLTWQIRDVYPIVAGTDCTHPDPAVLAVVHCGSPDAPLTLGFFTTGDRNDTVDMRADFDEYTVDAGAGNDRVTLAAGVGGQVNLHGGAGDDRLTVASDIAFVWIHGGTGDDAMCGGERVTVTYEQSPTSVMATIGGRGGAPGEHDTICARVGILIGSASNDRLVAADRGHVLDGGPGDDRLIGGAQADILQGWLGDDRLSGRGGADTLFGSDGDDQLSGDSGADANDGGSGTDRCRFDAADTYAGCELS